LRSADRWLDRHPPYSVMRSSETASSATWFASSSDRSWRSVEDAGRPSGWAACSCRAIAPPPGPRLRPRVCFSCESSTRLRLRQGP